MKDLIDWLAELEKRAATLYESAALLFKFDNELYTFLMKLAGEEKAHYELMLKAEELTDSNQVVPDILTLSDITKKRIDAFFDLFETRIKTKGLTRENLLDFIVSIEFSEFNNFFIYVMDSVKLRHPDFKHDADLMEQHKKDIIAFIASMPGKDKTIERMKALLNEDIVNDPCV